MPPLTPQEIKKLKTENIPDEVFEVFNTLIAREFNGSTTARVAQRDVVAALEAVNISEREALDNGWLDVEAAYEDKGWSVIYDKPGYNESYGAIFIFEVK